MMLYFSIKIKISIELQENSVVSVARVHELVWGRYVYSSFKYEYFYKGKRYSIKKGLGDVDHKSIINNYYIVEFSSQNPENSKIHLDLKIDDSSKIINAGFKK